MKTKLTRVYLLAWLVAAITVVVMPSCEKLKEATTFKVKYDLPDTYFTLDSSTFFKSERVLCTQSMNVNVDSIVGKNAGKLTRIQVYKMRFIIESPQGASLDWLSSARATLTPSGGEPVEIASGITINPDHTVDFITKDVDISPELKGPFLLTIYGTLNPGGVVPSNSLQLVFQSGLELSISPLN